MLITIMLTLPIISANDDVDLIVNDNQTINEDNEFDINSNDFENDSVQQSCENDIDVSYDTSMNMTSDRSISPTFTYNGYQIFIYNLEKYYGDSTPFGIMIWDSDNNTVSGIDVDFTINGQTYHKTTNILGQAVLSINLLGGVYDITTVVRDLDNITFLNNINVLTTIIGNDLVKYYKNGTQYYAIFYDTFGNFLTNTYVKFNINGVLYSRMTDDYGVAQLNINLSPGNYILTAYNPCNNESHSNTITVLTTLTASDLTMNFGDGSKFKAYLVDGQGNPYAGQTVTFNINGVFYQRTTDSNGFASLNINLIPGDYIITSSHNGLNISNNIHIN